MRNARLIVAFGIAAIALGACKEKTPPADQNMSLDNGMPTGVAGNADIETLPADESSTTPSSQLQNGFDDSGVNEAAPTENAY